MSNGNYAHIIPLFAGLIARWQGELDQVRSGRSDYFHRKMELVALNDGELRALARMVSLVMPSGTQIAVYLSLDLNTPPVHVLEATWEGDGNR